MKAKLKANWPYLLGITLAGVLHFLPFLLSGELLYASDQVASPGWKFFFDALHGGEVSLWNPLSLGGAPTYDALGGDITYPPFLLLGLIFPIEKVVGYNFLLHCIVAGWTAYALLRGRFGLDRLLATALSVAYMLNTNFLSLAFGGHTGKFFVLSWLPLGLYFLFALLEKGSRPRHLAGFALTVAVMVLTSHLQFTYYVLMGYFVYYVYKAGGALRDRDYRDAVWLSVRYWAGVLLGVGLCFFLLWPPMQYNKHFSVRGEGERQTYEHATSWSMHPEEVASLVVPEFGGINEHYWGRNPFKLNSEYPGIAVWTLGLFGLLAFRRRGFFWTWAAVGLLSIIYGLGAHTPLFRLFYEFVPGVKSFRAPSMMLFWLAAALLLMSAQALRLLTVERAALKVDWEQLSRRTLWIGGGAAVALILAGLLGSGTYAVWDAFVSPSEIPNIGNQSAATSAFSLGALRAGVLVLVLVFALRKWLLKERHERAFALALLAVVAADLYWVNKSFVETYPFERAFPREAAVDRLKSDTSDYRVYGLPGSYPKLYLQYHGIATVDGWADQEYRVYREYRGKDYNRDPNFMETLRQNPDGSVEGSAFLDMLNVKYLAFRIPQYPGLQLVENRSAMPRVWFATRWENVPVDAQVGRMRAADFDPRRLALVDTTLPAPGVDTVARFEARKEFYRNNAFGYRVSNDRPGIAVFSETWFPYWRLRVDGQPRPIVRVNYLFRGVYLEPGEHEVRMEYVSPALRKSFGISLASVLALVIACAGWAAMARRRAAAGAA
jgi:hypothetical protein